MLHAFRTRVHPSRIWFAIAVAAIHLSAAPALFAQSSDEWGSDAELCPDSVGMYTEHNGEQFAGRAEKEHETFFWARYRFVAYNQGGYGAIEMAGFFYISKAQCFFQEDKGVFIVVSPVIEYYGPVRVSCGGGGDGDAPGEEAMNSCPGGGGGTEPGGSSGQCYIVRLDHYYYHPETGEVTYRYSESFQYCEDST